MSGNLTSEQISAIRAKLIAAAPRSEMAASWAERFRDSPPEEHAAIAQEFLASVERFTDQILDSESTPSEAHGELAQVRRELDRVRQMQAKRAAQQRHNNDEGAR